MNAVTGLFKSRKANDANTLEVQQADGTQVFNVNTVTKGVSIASHLNIEETTTPTAIADSCALYSKADNKLYFQDGAGAEHEVTLTD